VKRLLVALLVLLCPVVGAAEAGFPIQFVCHGADHKNEAIFCTIFEHAFSANPAITMVDDTDREGHLRVVALPVWNEKGETLTIAIAFDFKLKQLNGLPLHVSTIITSFSMGKSEPSEEKDSGKLTFEGNPLVPLSKIILETAHEWLETNYNVIYSLCPDKTGKAV